MNCTKCNTPGAPCEMINGLCHRCTAARLNEANTQLTAWHKSFGATQLTHAISRLEAAERERDQLKAQLEAAQKAGAEMRTVLEVAQRNWAHGKVWLMDASALNHALSSDCGKDYVRREELPLFFADKQRPEIVCLCGSTRFIEHFAVMAWKFEKQGAIALGCHLLPQSYTTAESHQAEVEGVAHIMDELHRRKIELADRVFVLNVGGYVGKSTRSEIEYAKKLGKPIDWLEPDKSL